MIIDLKRGLGIFSLKHLYINTKNKIKSPACSTFDIVTTTLMFVGERHIEEEASWDWFEIFRWDHRWICDSLLITWLWRVSFGLIIIRCNTVLFIVVDNGTTNTRASYNPMWNEKRGRAQVFVYDLNSAWIRSQSIGKENLSTEKMIWLIELIWNKKLDKEFLHLLWFFPPW